MTPDEPTAQDLLRTASETFRADILPNVPEENKLDALMILNVLGLAERTLGDGGALAEAQRRRLDELGCATAAELAQAIRAGRFDDPKAAETLHRILFEDVSDRLRLSNPRYLAAADSG